MNSLLAHFAPSNATTAKKKTPPSAPRKSPLDREADDQQPGFVDGAPSNREDINDEEFEFTFDGGAVLKFENGAEEADADVHMLQSRMSTSSSSSSSTAAAASSPSSKVSSRPVVDREQEGEEQDEEEGSNTNDKGNFNTSNIVTTDNDGFVVPQPISSSFNSNHSNSDSQQGLFKVPPPPPPSRSNSNNNQFSIGGSNSRDNFFSQYSQQYSSQSYSQQGFSQFSQYSQDEISATPLDAAPVAVNGLRSPSPVQKRKSRRIGPSCFSPRGMDDLISATNDVATKHQRMMAPARKVKRQQQLSFASQSDTTKHLIISSQSSVSSHSPVESVFAPRPKIFVGNADSSGRMFGNNLFNGNSIVCPSSTGKENSKNYEMSRGIPSAPARRAKRELPRTSTNPFLPHERVLKKRSRRRRRQLPQLGSQDEIELSRYLEDFEEIETISTAGNFSTTIKCRCRIDGCLYAIKRAKKRIHNDADKRKQLKEVFALSALSQCSGVVDYYGAFIEDNRLYIQMELCEGCVSVNHVPTDTNNRIVWILDLLSQVSLALSDMHSRDIAHLDIKPDNILIARKTTNTENSDNNGSNSGSSSSSFSSSASTNSSNLIGDTIYKIGDLGLVSRVGAHFSSDDGDCVYLSGDMMNDSGKFKEADIFALGISAYHLLLKASSPPQNEHQIIREKGTLNFPSWIAPSQSNNHARVQTLQQLLLAMIHTNPEQRPTASQVHTIASECMKQLTSQSSTAATAAVTATAVPVGINGPTGVDVGLLSHKDLLHTYQQLNQHCLKMQREGTLLQEKCQHQQQVHQKLQAHVERLTNELQQMQNSAQHTAQQVHKMQQQQQRTRRTNKFGNIMGGVKGFNSSRSQPHKVNNRRGGGTNTSSGAALFEDDIDGF
jgi:hypothetical protein